MNTEHRTEDRQAGDANSSITSRKGGKDKKNLIDEGTHVVEEASVEASEFFQTWIGKAKDLPNLIEEQIKENPYKVLAAAAVVGTGFGVIVGSRVVRAVVMSVGSYALTEVLRSYAKELISGDDTSTAN